MTKLTHVLAQRKPADLAQTVVPEQTPITILTFELTRHHGSTGLPNDPNPSSQPRGTGDAERSF